MTRVDPPVVAITGAGSGIGRAVAEGMCAAGGTVLALERDPDRADRLRSDLGAAVHAIEGDATTIAGNAALAEAGAALGGVWGLVCTVGVFDQYRRLADLTPEQLDAAFTEIFDTNVRSTLLAVHALRQQLVAQRGAVVLTLSGSAFHPEGGGVLYGATKWSLRGVVAHLAAELAPEVRVNAVAPGGTSGTATAGLRTLRQQPNAVEDPARDARLLARSPLEVTVTPEDVAASYLFLLGPAARTMTGRTLHPDGGLTVYPIGARATATGTSS